MSKLLHILATLLIIGAVSGGALNLLNEQTADAIAANEEKNLAENSRKVMPNADRFEELAAKLAPVGEGEAFEFKYFKALDADGNPVGYIVTSEGPGFQSTIKAVFGVTLDLKTITGARFEAMETPGYGDILQKEIFYGQFDDHTTNDEFLITNSIGKPVNEPDDPNIETRSGATVSQAASVRIVNEGLLKIKAVVGEGTADNNTEKQDNKDNSTEENNG